MQNHTAYPSQSLLRLIPSSAFRVIVAVVILFLLSQNLNPSDLGLYSLVVSVYSLALNFSSLGIDNWLGVKISQQDVSSKGILVLSCFQFLLAFAFVSISSICLFNLGQAPLLLLLLLGLGCFLGRTCEIIETTLVYLKFSKPVAISKYIYSISGAVLITIACMYNYLDLISLAYVLLIQQLLRAGYLIIFTLYCFSRSLLSSLGNLDLSLLPRNIANYFYIAVKKSSHLFIASISVFVIARSDIIMISLLSGDNEAGLYAFSLRLSEILLFVPPLMSQVFMPFINYSGEINVESKLNKLYYKYHWYSTNIVFICTLAIAIIVTRYSSSYSGTFLSTLILTTSIYLVSAGCYTSSLLKLRGMHSLIMTRNVLAAIFNIALNFVLIPGFGSAGASFSTLFSLLLGLLLPLCYLAKSSPSRQVLTSYFNSIVKLDLA